MNRINVFITKNQAGISEEQVVELLERVFQQYRDVQLVKTCAALAELTLGQVFSDDRIELDFDLTNKGVYLCHIYKAWTDPGFRIGRDLPLDKTIPNFREKFLQIIKICSTNFIAFEPKDQETSSQAILMLEIGIFEGGFNEKVLRKAVEILEAVLKEIKIILEE